MEESRTRRERADGPARPTSTPSHSRRVPPFSLIGSTIRLVHDECQHADYCRRLAVALGDETLAGPPNGGVRLFNDKGDPWVVIARSIILVCVFVQTISVPALESLCAIVGDPLIHSVYSTVASDEGHHNRFGWEAVDWLTMHLSEESLTEVLAVLPRLMATFERTCFGGPEALAQLPAAELIVTTQPGTLGTLERLEYAAPFYHAVQETVPPRLDGLGLDGNRSWARRGQPHSTAQ